MSSAIAWQTRPSPGGLTPATLSPWSRGEGKLLIMLLFSDVRVRYGARGRKERFGREFLVLRLQPYHAAGHAGGVEIGLAGEGLGFEDGDEAVGGRG